MSRAKGKHYVTPHTVLLHCRAQVHPDCKKEWVASDEDLTDSTMDYSGTVVCFPCYIEIEPFMRMNRDDKPREADVALGHYKANLTWVQKHPNPQELVEEAADRAADAHPGTPFYILALACKKMAEKEVQRRASADRPDVT
jgi:hypothetical protein